MEIYQNLRQKLVPLVDCHQSTFKVGVSINWIQTKMGSVLMHKVISVYFSEKTLWGNDSWDGRENGAQHDELEPNCKIKPSIDSENGVW